MTDKILEIIGTAFPIRERDMGRYKYARGGPMKFISESYEAEGLGNVCVMKGTALMGLMKMDTVIINPFDIDLPLVSYDRIHAIGNDTFLLEVYETRLDKSGSLPDYNSIAGKLEGIPHKETEKRWYSSLILPGTFENTGKKKDTPAIDSFVEEYMKIFTSFAKTFTSCDRQAKIKAASIYTEGLISNGGTSTDQLVKSNGEDFTYTLFRKYMFGTGTPE